MPSPLVRRLCFVSLGIFCLSGANCGGNGGGSHTPALSQPVAGLGNTEAANGGPSAAAAAMNGNASALASLIMNYRQQAGLPAVTANDTLAGVAQWQADDMAAHDYIGLVGSDGEDAFQRLANSGFADAAAGVIAVGYSGNAQDVFNDLVASPSADAVLLYRGSDGFSSIGVGYSNGYWMVILGGAPTGTGTTPPAPTLSATAGDGSVALTWTASPGATSYDIYRGTASGGETSYQTRLTGTTYTDTGVTDGTTYYYTVAGVNSAGTGGPSNEASATPTATGSAPAAPTLSAVAGTGSVSLAWSTSAGATSYDIYRGAASGSETSYQTGVTATFYVDSGVTNGTTYYYTVAAVNSFGTSAPSNEVSATPTGTSSLQIVTTTVPNATVGQAYSATISTAGGTGAVTLSVSSGSLPPGLALGPGAPSAATFVGSGLNEPIGLAFDAAGNLYVANFGNNTISKVTPAGARSTFVSSGLHTPQYLAFDSAGNLYVANEYNDTISKVTPTGVTSTFVGSGLSSPTGLAIDSAGNLYVANWGNGAISKVTPAGVTSTFVSGLNGPDGLAFDTAGNLYVASWDGNNTITKVTPTGATSTFVSSGLDYPAGLALDTAGNLYVANGNPNNTITKVTPAGVTSTFVNSGLSTPSGLAFDATGNFYVTNFSNNTITKVTPVNAGLSGTPTASGSFNFTVTATDSVGDTASQAYALTINPAAALTIVTTTVPNGNVNQFYSATISTTGGTGAVTLSVSAGSLPPGLTLYSVGPAGTPTASGTFNFTVTATDSVDDTVSQSYALIINPTAATLTIVTNTLPNYFVDIVGYSAGISTAGGTGAVTLSVSAGSLPPGLSLSNAGSTTTFASTGFGSWPVGVAVDTAGNLYVSNQYNTTINKVTPAGATSSFATLPPFSTANLLTFDPAGNLYVSASNGGGSVIVFKVTPAGVTSTFVTLGSGTPGGLAFDTAGNLYVAVNSFPSSITKVTPAGATSTFVSSFLFNPYGLAFDTAGNLCVVDQATQSILKVTPAGVTSTFVTLGGYSPYGLALDTAGNLYVSYYSANGIDKVTPAGVTIPYVSTGIVQGEGLAFDAAGNLYVANNFDTSTITKVTPTGGMVWGTPTAVGAYNFTVTATDSLGATASQSYTLDIDP